MDQKNGFGGVELAWVYPLVTCQKKEVPYIPSKEWLSPYWQEIVAYTIAYAEQIRWGCGLIFGTLRPPRR